MDNSPLYVDIGRADTLSQEMSTLENMHYV